LVFGNNCNVCLIFGRLFGDLVGLDKYLTPLKNAKKMAAAASFFSHLVKKKMVFFKSHKSLLYYHKRQMMRTNAPNHYTTLVGPLRFMSGVVFRNTRKMTKMKKVKKMKMAWGPKNLRNGRQRGAA
jgi:hypothetical protein